MKFDLFGERGKEMSIAGLFPGQGAQSVGMLAELASSHPIVTETFQQASDIVGYDLWEMVQHGSEASLGKTEVTQPVMLSAGVAVWRVWQQQGGELPVASAGHSLGEYTALVAANSVSFSDAVTLVVERARLMQQAVPEGQGAMAAILGMDDAIIIAICDKASKQVNGIVEAVNFNSPDQVVIAGDQVAVDQALMLLTAAGAKKVVKLPVSVPSHCQLMRPAADILSIALSRTDFKRPQFAVLHNVDATVRDDVEAIKLALTAQLYCPVLWVKTIRALQTTYQANLMLEFGSKVLTGLNRRIERRLATTAIFDNASLEAALALSEDRKQNAN